MAFLGLPMPRVAVTAGPQQRVVDVAHDVLSQRVEAVRVVLARPVAGDAAVEGSVVCAKDGLETNIDDKLEGKAWERARAEMRGEGDNTNRAVHRVVCFDDVHLITCSIR
jgi:hypothetical protein